MTDAHLMPTPWAQEKMVPELFSAVHLNDGADTVTHIVPCASRTPVIWTAQLGGIPQESIMGRIRQYEIAANWRGGLLIFQVRAHLAHGSGNASACRTPHIQHKGSEILLTPELPLLSTVGKKNLIPGDFSICIVGMQKQAKKKSTDKGKAG